MRHRRVRIIVTNKRTGQRIEISLSVLFVHRDVNDRIQTRRQINEYIPNHVEHRAFHFRIEYLNHGYRQIADDEAQEDQKHHLGDVHFAPFGVHPGSVFLHAFARFAHDPVYLGVAHYDYDAGQCESDYEEGGFRAVSVIVLFYRARAQVFVVAEYSPHS